MQLNYNNTKTIFTLINIATILVVIMLAYGVYKLNTGPVVMVGQFSWSLITMLLVFLTTLLLYKLHKLVTMEQKTAAKHMEVAKISKNLIHSSAKEVTKPYTEDPLKEIMNRWVFDDVLAKHVAAAARNNERCALILIDLDYFKDINEMYGHSKGDQFLIKVVGLFKYCIRDGDYFARLGGDEFALLLTSLSDDYNALTVVNRIYEHAKEKVQLGSVVFEPSFSCGIVNYPEDAGSAETLLLHADLSLTKAKAQGKNQFCCYNPRLKEEYKRKELIISLINGPFNTSFKLAYQPIYSINSIDDKVIIGGEFLLRFHEFAPFHCNIEELIVAAEERKSIVNLGWNIIDHALWLLHNAPMFDDKISFSINISAIQLAEENFSKIFLDQLKSSNIDFSRVNVEVTESSFSFEHKVTMDNLTTLREHGIGVLIDDFGKGYSSLLRLSSMPVTGLKIDKDFTQLIDVDVVTRDVVATIVNLAKSLDITVTAEGVETKEQLDILVAMGCDYYQGFYLARPINLPARLVNITN